MSNFNSPNNRRNKSPLGKIAYALLSVDRKIAGLTIRQAAKLVGVNHSSIWRWEHGDETPTIKNLVKYAYVLGTNPRDYVDDIYKKAVFIFEEKIAVYIRENEEALESITKGDISLMRILKQMDVVEENLHIEETPQHTPLKDLVENDLVDD